MLSMLLHSILRSLPIAKKPPVISSFILYGILDLKEQAIIHAEVLTDAWVCLWQTTDK